MLTLREPIALKTMEQPLVFSESFGEKIAANYQMMAARFAPKDLLLLLVAPPEYPELAAGGTSIAMQTDIRQTRNTLVEVVNNVTNRILLLHDQSFTYQDQVYITNFLQKIGVTDVAQFVREVKNLTAESRNIHKLLSLYQENSSLLALALEEHKPPKAPRKRKKQAKKQPRAAEAELTLHSQIFRRLDTDRILHMFYRFQKNAALPGQVLHRSELRVANHLRMADMIALTQVKQALFRQEALTHIQHVNRYETGELLPPPAAEEQVLSQGAAATLVDLVSNALSVRMAQYATRQEVWLDIRNAISQSAQHSLARFESYHTQNSAAPAVSRHTSRQTNILQREEIRLLERFLRSAPPANISLIHQLHTQDFTELTQASPQNLALTQEGSQYLEALLQLQRAESRLYASSAVFRREENLSLQTLLENNLFSAETRAIINQQFLTFAGEEAQAPSSAEELPLVERREPDPYAPLTESLERLEQAAAEEDRAELQKRLEEINRQNLIRHQQVLERQAERPRYDVPPVPDKRRTFQDALRALDHPEQVLQELRESPPAPVQQAQQQTPIEVLLAQTDPETRQIFEAVFQYQQNPQEAAQAGIVRPENLAVFNRQVLVGREVVSKTVEEIGQLEEETRRLKVQAGRSGTGFAPEHPGKGERPGPPVAARPRVPTVHKAVEERGLPQELLEHLEQQQHRRESIHTTSTQTVSAQETVQQTEITRQSAELVQKTTEDIAEMVNRTLARQIGAISDQVLHKMERRLELDRARRGRF